MGISNSKDSALYDVNAPGNEYFTAFYLGALALLTYSLVDLNTFKLLETIGKGAFGKVK